MDVLWGRLYVPSTLLLNDVAIEPSRRQKKPRVVGFPIVSCTYVVV